MALEDENKILTLEEIINLLKSNPNKSCYKNDHYIVVKYTPRGTPKLPEFYVICLKEEGHKLGKGAFGIVYKAYLYGENPKKDDKNTQPKFYAIKHEILTEKLTSEEIKNTATIQSLKGFGSKLVESEDECFTISDELGEEIANASNHTINTEIKLLTLAGRINIITQILLGLDHIQNLKKNSPAVIHRDIKPDNILAKSSTRTIDKEEVKQIDVTIIDFNLAIALTADQNTDELHHLDKLGIEQAGTPDFSMPELIHNVGKKQDLWALMPVIIYLLGGKPFECFQDTTPGKLFINFGKPYHYADILDLNNSEIPKLKEDLSKLKTDIRAIVKAFIEKNLANNYNDRPNTETCLKFYNTLHNLLKLIELKPDEDQRPYIQELIKLSGIEFDRPKDIATDIATSQLTKNAFNKITEIIKLDSNDPVLTKIKKIAKKFKETVLYEVQNLITQALSENPDEEKYKKILSVIQNEFHHKITQNEFEKLNIMTDLKINFENTFLNFTFEHEKIKTDSKNITTHKNAVIKINKLYEKLKKLEYIRSRNSGDNLKKFDLLIYLSYELFKIAKDEISFGKRNGSRLYNAIMREIARINGINITDQPTQEAREYIEDWMFQKEPIYKHVKIQEYTNPEELNEKLKDFNLRKRIEKIIEILQSSYNPTDGYLPVPKKLTDKVNDNILKSSIPTIICILGGKEPWKNFTEASSYSVTQAIIGTLACVGPAKEYSIPNDALFYSEDVLNLDSAIPNLNKDIQRLNTAIDGDIVAIIKAFIKKIQTENIDEKKILKFFKNLNQLLQLIGTSSDKDKQLYINKLAKYSGYSLKPSVPAISPEKQSEINDIVDKLKGKIENHPTTTTKLVLDEISKKNNYTKEDLNKFSSKFNYAWSDRTWVTTFFSRGAGSNVFYDDWRNPFVAHRAEQALSDINTPDANSLSPEEKSIYAQIETLKDKATKLKITWRDALAQTENLIIDGLKLEPNNDNYKNSLQIIQERFHHKFLQDNLEKQNLLPTIQSEPLHGFLRFNFENEEIGNKTTHKVALEKIKKLYDILRQSPISTNEENIKLSDRYNLINYLTYQLFKIAQNEIGVGRHNGSRLYNYVMFEICRLQGINLGTDSKLKFKKGQDHWMLVRNFVEDTFSKQEASLKENARLFCLAHKDIPNLPEPIEKRSWNIPCLGR